MLKIFHFSNPLFLINIHNLISRSSLDSIRLATSLESYFERRLFLFFLRLPFRFRATMKFVIYKKRETENGIHKVIAKSQWKKHTPFSWWRFVWLCMGQYMTRGTVKHIMTFRALYAYGTQLRPSRIRFFTQSNNRTSFSHFVGHYCWKLFEYSILICTFFPFVDEQFCHICTIQYSF